MCQVEQRGACLSKASITFNWIIADQQIDGRGRRGNIWSSPMGGLYATTVISDAKLDYSHVSQLSILSAVVAAKTIEDIIGKNKIQLKEGQ